MKRHVGCSGFHYKDCKDSFYPANIPQRLWLEYYAEEFDTVELNNTFYRMPKDSTFQGWYERTPKDFQFTIKGSRFITHIKRLKEVSKPLKNMYDAASLLKEKLSKRETLIFISTMTTRHMPLKMPGDIKN